MLAKEIEVGKSYRCIVSQKLQVVKITGVSPYKGWTAVNEATGRQITIRSAGKLRPLEAPLTLCKEHGTKSCGVCYREGKEFTNQKCFTLF